MRKLLEPQRGEDKWLKRDSLEREKELSGVLSFVMPCMIVFIVFRSLGFFGLACSQCRIHKILCSLSGASLQDVKELGPSKWICGGSEDHNLIPEWPFKLALASPA